MGSTDATDSQIALLRKALLVNFAVGQQLDAVGNNHGVPRPDLTNSDDLYRGVIKALAWLPKQGLLSYYALLSAVFGTQEEVTNLIGRPWKVFEVNANEVIIEIPEALISGNVEVNAYTHGASGYAYVAAGPTDTFTTNFDLQLSAATSIIGYAIHIETAVNTWTDYTILAYSFNAGTSTATVQVSAATVPTGGGRFYLEVPGDNVKSYRGKYITTGGVSTTYSTAAGPNTNTLLVVGDVTRDVEQNMTISISISGVFSTRVVTSASYSNATNITTVVITTTDVPGGQANQQFILAEEVADTATTPPHNDRIYLTGTGLYQVVQFYLDLLVRAAGIVVRLEII